MAVPVGPIASEMTSGEYTIRWYEDRDREAFIELYNLAFSGCSPDWFSWKYEQCPYADHVPIIVAEKDGELGGFRPVLPLPVQVGDRTVTTLQLIDLMVHPDHRRQGLMTKMYEWMRRECWDDYTATFTYANEASRRGMLKMNDDMWTHHDLGRFVKYERLQNLPALTTAEQGAAVQFGARVINPFYRLKTRLQDRLKVTDADITVTRHDSVRPDILTEVYASITTDQPHLRRDEAFYTWRFAQPDTEFVMYSASRDGVRNAAIVVGVDTDPAGVRSAHLTEVLPLAGGASLGAAFSALLARITDDFPDADLISASAGIIPHRVLAAYGFIRSDSVLLSPFTDSSWFLVCLLGSADATDAGIATALLDDGGWTMTFCERLLG